MGNLRELTELPMNKNRQALPVWSIASWEKSHFFGFHDLCPTDAEETMALAVGVDFLDRPPGPDDRAEVAVVDLATGRVRILDETTAWNFPQGARQQWWPGKSSTVVYNKIVNGDTVAIVRDVGGDELTRLHGGVYCVTPDGRTALSYNFRRTHALGGYGYAGADSSDQCLARSPEEDGIWRTDVASGRRELIVSLAAVARLANSPSEHGQSQYVTHILPSPDGQTICFLHRSWHRDGGINTAVCVCRPDGGGLRILAQGYFSHFDWRDNEHLLFWGRSKDRLQSIRASSGRGMGALLRVARPVWRALRHLRLRMHVAIDSYQLISINTGSSVPFFQDKLHEDGHPSFFAHGRGWLVTDTYPDSRGWRNLFIVRLDDGQVFDLGRLRERSVTLHPSAHYLARTGVGPEALARHGIQEYFRTRSGYACDFHPRFSSRGSMVLIDSVHTGRRAIFGVDVSGIVRPS